MENINKVLLAGTVSFAEYKTASSGNPYLRFSVKTQKSTGYDTTISTVCFGSAAKENANLKPGDLVDVIGELTNSKNKMTDKWELNMIALVVKRVQGSQSNTAGVQSQADRIPF